MILSNWNVSRKLDAKSAKFRLRILTEEELAIYESLTAHRRVEFLAGRFAGKEAFSKAKGTGIGCHMQFFRHQYLT